MSRRHPALSQPLPQYWLMTDERMGDGLIPAVRRLPKGKSGVVLRNYATPKPERRRLFETVRAIARRNRLLLILAGTERMARAWKAGGWHGNTGIRNPRLIHSMAAHDMRELVAAAGAGADLVFLSPVFATRSHPGERALGIVRFGLLARHARMPVIALGGMTSHRARPLKAAGVSGYAAIDDWMR